MQLRISVVRGHERYGGWVRCCLKGRRPGYGRACCASNLHPIPRYVGSEVGNLYHSLSLMLCNAKSIHKTTSMQAYFSEQNVDMAHVTETWVQEGKTVTLTHLAV